MADSGTPIAKEVIHASDITNNYYTKSSIDSALNGKANSSHPHNIRCTELGRKTGNSATTITLNQSVENFDLILVRARHNNGFWFPNSVLIANLWSEHASNSTRFLSCTDTAYVEYYFTSATGFHIAGGNNNLVIVYGIKIS